LPAGYSAHAGEGAEGVICEDVDALRGDVRYAWCGWGWGGMYAVVGLQVVDLFAEDEHPEVFAEELDHV
jgi:hypothetical protein